MSRCQFMVATHRQDKEKKKKKNDLNHHHVKKRFLIYYFFSDWVDRERINMTGSANES